MSTVQQTTKTTQPDEAINFLVPAEFKLEVDLEVKRRRTSLRELGTRAFAKELGLPVPGEAPESKRKRA